MFERRSVRLFGVLFRVAIYCRVHMALELGSFGIPILLSPFSFPFPFPFPFSQVRWLTRGTSGRVCAGIIAITGVPHGRHIGQVVVGVAKAGSNIRRTLHEQ